MTTSQFMRGDPLNLTETFYLTVTNGNITYIYCYNSSNYSINSTIPTAGFLEMTSSYASYDTVQFTIVSLGNNKYSFYSNGLYLGLDSNNILDLTSDTAVSIIISKPEDATSNIYNIANVLYPSVAYTMSINTTSYKWYTFNPISTSNWDTYTISANTLNPYIFPVNSGQLALWQVTSTYPNGACFYSSTNDGIALEWLYNWTQGTSVNCDTEGTLDSTYDNCYFSSLLACESLYVYNLCTGTSTCGNCQGMLPSGETTGACYYNIPGSATPMYVATEPSTLTTNDAIELPDTSSNDGSGSGCGIAGIIFIVIFFLILVIIIGVVVYKSSKKKDSSDKNNKQKST